MTVSAFYAVEALVARGFLDPLGPAEYGYLAMPSLALCEVETGAATTTLVTVSDAGYRTLSTDAGGVVAYPPKINEAFSVDVSANLDPTQSAVAAAWGTLSLSNVDHSFDAMIAGWRTDGQSITILRGEKTLEDFPGQRTQRSTAATFLDGVGVLESSGPGVVRSADYTGGLTLTARGVTNAIRNSAMSGVATGTPGTLPSNWSFPAQVGLSTQIVATGTVSGLPYVDIRWFGTLTAGFVAVYFENATTVHSPNGATWTSAVSTQLIAGTLTGVPSILIDIVAYDGTGTGLSDNASGISLPTSSLVRASITKTLATAGTAFISTRLQPGVTTGTAVDFTLRIAGPQLEGGNVVSAYVSTTSTAATRAPTYNAGTPATLNEAAATNYVLSTQTPGALNVTVATSTEVPAMLAGLPVYKAFRSATGTDTNSCTITLSGLPTTGPIIRASVWVWFPWFMPSKTSIAIGLEGNATLGSGILLDQSKYDQWQRITCVATLTAGQSTSNIVLRVNTQLLGDTFYTTGWQLEIDAGTGAPTSFITPAVTPAVRAADLLYTARNIWIDPPRAALVPVFQGIMGPWQNVANQVSVALRDVSYYLERTVKRLTYAGTGGREGTIDLAGVNKPMLAAGAVDASFNVSDTMNVSPLLIDPANLIYQFSTAYNGQLDAVYDGGVALTPDTITFVDDLYASAPSAGKWRADGNGLIRLGSSPVFGVTADVFNVSGPIYNVLNRIVYHSLTAVLGVPAALIASGVGLGTVILTQGVDPTLAAQAMALLTSLYLSSNDSLDGITFTSRLLGASGALLVPGRDGKLRLLVLSAIPPATASVLTLDHSVIVSVTPVALPTSIDPPPWRIRLAYGRNWTVQTSPLAGGVTPARQAFISVPARVVTGTAVLLSSGSTAPPTDPPVIGLDSGSVDLTAAAPQLVVNGMIALWGIKRRLYEIVVPASVGLTLDWASVVTVISDFDGLQSPGAQGQIVGWRYSSADSTATFRVLI